jgi:hypothetical protein
MASEHPTKKCSKCAGDFPATVEFFSRYKRAKSGIRADCKQCQSEAAKEYARKYPEKMKELQSKGIKRRLQRNRAARDPESLARQEQYQKDREAWEAEYKPVYQRKSELTSEQMVKRKEANAKLRAKRKAEREADPQGARQRERQRYLKYRHGKNAYMRRYYHEKLKRKPGYRLRLNMTKAVNIALKGGKNGRSWENLVGYTIKELIAHLEILFQPGMDWSNYGKGAGKWSLDHKRPVSSFNIVSTADPDFRDCWALKNLQPLWDADNISKGNKWVS